MFKRLFKIVGGLAGMALGLVTASCGDSEKMATIYGPPSSFDGNYSLEEIECCGKKGTPESVEFQACIEDYRWSRTCDGSGPVHTYYGPAPVEPGYTDPVEPGYTDEERACCEGYAEEGSPMFDECVAEYRESGRCKHYVALYGPIPTEYTDEEKACCLDEGEEGSLSFEVCVDAYRESGECRNVEEPIPVVYGPAPIEPDPEPEEEK